MKGGGEGREEGGRERSGGKRGGGEREEGWFGLHKSPFLRVDSHPPLIFHSVVGG